MPIPCETSIGMTILPAVSNHYRFDEGMTDLPDPTPNIKILQRYEDNLPVTIETIDPPDYILTVEPTLFHNLDTIRITITCDFPTFGIEIGECHIRGRAYISSVTPNSSVTDIRNFQRKYVGAFNNEINHIPVFDVADANTIFAQIYHNDTIERFDIVLAPDRYVPVQNRREFLTLDVNQIRHITLLCHPTLEVDTSVTNEDIQHHVRSILDPSVITIPMSADETALNGRFSRKKLK